MNNCLRIKGQVRDWRAQMQIYAIASELLKIKSREDLVENFLSSPEEETSLFDEIAESSMKKMNSFFPDKQFYLDLDYGYDYSDNCVLQGFVIGYSTKADEDDFNRELRKKGEIPMVVNWPTQSFCTVLIPELASKDIRY